MRCPATEMGESATLMCAAEPATSLAAGRFAYLTPSSRTGQAAISIGKSRLGLAAPNRAGPQLRRLLICVTAAI